VSEPSQPKAEDRAWLESLRPTVRARVLQGRREWAAQVEAMREIRAQRSKLAELEKGFRERWGPIGLEAVFNGERETLAAALELEAIRTLAEIGCSGPAEPPWVLEEIGTPADPKDGEAREFALRLLSLVASLREGDSHSAVLALLVAVEQAPIAKAVRVLTSARAAGKRGGRPPKITAEARNTIRAAAERADRSRPSRGLAAAIGADLGLDVNPDYLAALVSKLRPPREPRIPRARPRKRP
jgi:hypothetical protein